MKDLKIVINTDDTTKITGDIYFSQGINVNPKVFLIVNEISVNAVFAFPAKKPPAKGLAVRHFRFSFPIRHSLRQVLPKESRVSVSLEIADDPVISNVAASANYEGLAEDEGSLLVKALKTQRINRSGFLVTPFSSDPQKKIQVLKQYNSARSLFNIFGVDLYITGGNLLGIIREGDFIGHDDDLDCSFCFTAESPELAVEQYQKFIKNMIPTALCGGFSIFDIYPGQFHLSSNRFDAHVDCLAGWIQPNGKWYRFTSFGGYRGISDLKLKQTSLHGIEILIPEDAEKELEITYGKGWRTPQEIYRHTHTAEAKTALERFSTAMGEGVRRMREAIPKVEARVVQARAAFDGSAE